MTETPKTPRTQTPSARLCAAWAVVHVLRDGEQLENALSRQPSFLKLEPRDRAFARLIAATVFRRKGQIDAALKPFIKQKPAPLPHAILRTGAAQILFLKTAPHAAVGESVALLKKSRKTHAYAGMVNAVLRRVSEQGAALSVAVAPSENIPGWIRASWEKAYGKSAMRRMAGQFLKEPPLDIVVRSDPAGWAERLGGTAVAGNTVRLTSGGHIPDLPGFEDGQWWVQDLAASTPVRMLGDVSGLRVLDMCAAPGGKTMQLAAGGAHVTALDKSDERLDRVRENLARTKLSADIVVGDARDWSPEGGALFDVVVLDAPCSSSGTYRRHPDVLYNKAPKDVGALARLQRKLLVKAQGWVKPGGKLLYCTCSLQPEEGEMQMDRFLETHKNMSLTPPVALNMPDSDNYMTQKEYVRLLPHFAGEIGGMDGFFAAIVVRNVR